MYHSSSCLIFMLVLSYPEPASCSQGIFATLVYFKVLYLNIYSMRKPQLSQSKRIGARYKLSQVFAEQSLQDLFIGF